MARKKYYTQEMVLEERIENRIVELKDGRKLTFVEVRPINFNNKSEAEQKSIVSSILGWYKICPRRFQLKILTTRADAKEHTTAVLRDLSREKNRKIVTTGMSYCQFVEYCSLQHALRKRFIFIFSDDAIDTKRLTDEANRAELMDAANQCRQYFMANGHHVVTFDDPQKEDEYIRNLIYELYNPIIHNYDTSISRKNKIKEDFVLWNPGIQEKEIPLSYQLCAKGIDLRHKDYIVIDGIYRSYYIIAADGLPSLITPGWLGRLPLTDGMHLDMFVEKFSDLASLRIIDNLSGKGAASNAPSSSTARNYLAMKESTQFLIQSLENGEEIFNVSLLFTIESKTLNALFESQKRLKQFFISKGILLLPCTFQQEAAFRSTLYRNRLDENLKRKSSQNITTVSLAALYPLTAFEMADPDGIFLGLNNENSSPVTYDPFDTSAHENANICCMGATGKGKTMTLCLLAFRLRMRNIPVFIIAPIKAIEYHPIVELCGGTYVTLSDASPDCINVMEIRPMNQDSEALLTGAVVQRYSLLAQKIDDLEVLLSMIYPSVNESIQQVYNNCCMRTYAKVGITMDNDSLYLDKEKKTRKTMPILGDLVKEIEEAAKIDDSIRDLVNVMSRFTTGSSQRFNGQTNVDLTTKMVVIDVERLSEKLKPFGMFVASSVIKSYIEEDRTAKKMLIIDEAWTMIGPNSTPRVAGFVTQWCKVARGLGAGICIAFQEINDAFSYDEGKYGKAVLNACETMILLGMKEQQADQTKEILHLTEKERDSLISARRGQALLCSGNRVVINIMPSKEELMAFTTDRKLLEKKAMQKKEQQEKEGRI